MSSTIILISCSNHKKEGGKRIYHPGDSILSTVTKDTKKVIIDKRYKILKLIQDGKIEDLLRGDGNRKDSGYNMSLVKGPEFTSDFNGEQPLKGEYMPAYKRYSGRFYSAAGIDAFETGAMEKEYHTLIASGLYGLITQFEPIQAYNCHLDDEVCSDEDNLDFAKQNIFRVSDIWRSEHIFDLILKDFIKKHNQEYNHKIEYIIDLLSEFSYQNMFSWDEISGFLRNNNIKRFHRVIYNIREPEFSADLGRFYRFEVVKENGFFSNPTLGKIKESYLDTILRDSGSLSFSSKIETDRFFEAKLIKKVGHILWNKLDDPTKLDLIQGEKYFQMYDAISKKDPDEFAPRIAHFFTALEHEMHLKCGKGTKRQGLGKLYIRLRFGDLKYFVTDDLAKRKFCEKLNKIAEIRNDLSHDGYIYRREFLKARDMILNPNGILSMVVSMNTRG